MTIPIFPRLNLAIIPPKELQTTFDFNKTEKPPTVKAGKIDSSVHHLKEFTFEVNEFTLFGADELGSCRFPYYYFKLTAPTKE